MITEDFDELSGKVKVLYNFKDKTGSYAVNKDGKDHDNLYKLACHAGIRSVKPESLTDFIGSYHMEATGAPELWEYLTSLEGPFRDIFKFAPDGWSLLSHKKEVFGFRMPDKVFSFKPYPLVYAFLICTRMPHEYYDQVKIFKYLVDKSIDKNKAFLLMTYLSLDSGEIRVKPNSGWHGSHQCLRDYSGSCIDFKKWSNGEYNTEDIKDNTLTNVLWSIPSKQSLSKFMWSAYGTVTYSKFGGTIVTVKEDGLNKMVEDLDKYLELRYK